MPAATGRVWCMFRLNWPGPPLNACVFWFMPFSKLRKSHWPTGRHSQMWEVVSTCRGSPQLMGDVSSLANSSGRQPIFFAEVLGELSNFQRLPQIGFSFFFYTTLLPLCSCFLGFFSNRLLSTSFAGSVLKEAKLRQWPSKKNPISEDSHHQEKETTNPTSRSIHTAGMRNARNNLIMILRILSER